MITATNQPTADPQIVINVPPGKPATPVLPPISRLLLGNANPAARIAIHALTNQSAPFVITERFSRMDFVWMLPVATDTIYPQQYAPPVQQTALLAQPTTHVTAATTGTTDPVAQVHVPPSARFATKPREHALSAIQTTISIREAALPIHAYFATEWQNGKRQPVLKIPAKPAYPTVSFVALKMCV